MCQPGSAGKLHCDVFQANHGEPTALLCFPNGKKFKIIILWPFLVHLNTFLNETCGFFSSEAVCKLCIRKAASKQQEMALPEPCALYQVCLSAPFILLLLSKAAFEMLQVKCGNISSIYLHTKCSRISLTYALQVVFFFPGSPMVSIWCFGDPEAFVCAPDLGFYLLVVLISASSTTRQGSQLSCCWTCVIQDKISHSLSFVSDTLASTASCGPAAWEQRTQDQFLI